MLIICYIVIYIYIFSFWSNRDRWTFSPLQNIGKNYHLILPPPPKIMGGAGFVLWREETHG